MFNRDNPMNKVACLPWLFLSFLAWQINAKDNDIFLLQSPDFTDNAMLNGKFGESQAKNANCVGQNESPTLIWSNPPTTTQSYALLVFDPEGANGLGISHLVAYNIPAGATGFGFNDLSQGKGFTAGKNSSGSRAWHGPCPPAGKGAHHYIFTLIATDARPQLPEGLKRDALLDKLKGHALGVAGLVGRFGH